MKKLTFEEILSILKEKIEHVRQFATEDYDSEELELGKIEEVEQHGGEGEGEDWYSVKYFKDHDVYIKVSGFYQSYDGIEFYNGWNSCKEVKPIPKTIVVYE